MQNSQSILVLFNTLDTDFAVYHKSLGNKSIIWPKCMSDWQQKLTEHYGLASVHSVVW